MTVADQVLPALVDCKPMSARMTEAACVKRWRSAQGDTPPPSWDSRRHCHGCPIGATRAGVDVAVAEAQARAAALAETMRHLCPRCERVAPRLIHGRHCISCYNRDREARIGRNAKGTRPRLADIIHPETLTVGGRVVRLDNVASRIEAAAIAARRAAPGAIIGVPPLHLVTEAGAA